MSEMVSITALRLRQLQEAEETLNALVAGGVDNWEWYSDSLAVAGLLDDDDND